MCAISSVLFTGFVAYGASLNDHGPFVYAALAVATLQLLVGVADTDINVKSRCRDFFLLTPRVGGIVVAGFIGDALVHRWTNGISF